MDDMMSKIQSILNDEESMNQIKKLANMLSEGNGDVSNISSIFNSNSNDDNCDNSNSPSNLDFDISKIIAIQQILKQANVKDKNTEFLLALRPLLKHENQVKIDKITKVFKLLTLWPLIKESGILGGDIFDIL